MLFCCEEKANQMKGEKPQAVTVIRFVACGFWGPIRGGGGGGGSEYPVSH